MKQKLLFVAKGGEDSVEGFSYVLDLAKTLDTGIEVLLVYGNRATQSFEDIMAAVAFAEAGDLKTVKELIESEERALNENAERKIEELRQRCKGVIGEFGFRVVSGDTVSLIRDTLKGMPSIMMVLISPSLSENKVFDLKKLLKNISKPVVAITRAVGSGSQTRAEMEEAHEDY